MTSAKERERRVGRKLFNEGVATEEEHDYTCDRCGLIKRTTSNYDGMRHALPLPACGGIFHAEMGPVRLKKAAPRLLKLCRDLAEADKWLGHSSAPDRARWLEEMVVRARELVEAVDAGERKAAR